MSRYNSSKSVGYRKPVWLDSNDPRARSEYELEKYRSRIGAEVLVRDNSIVNKTIQEESGTCLSIGTDGYEISQGDSGPGINIYHHNFSLIAVDSEQNIVCSGTYDLNQDGTDAGYDDNVMLVKFSKNGDLVWQIFLDDSDQDLSVRDIKIDKNNDIYITGKDETVSVDGFFIAKYLSDGTKSWSKRISTPSTTSYLLASNIQFDATESKLYLAAGRMRSAALGTPALYFYAYEISTSSGNLLRSNKLYGDDPASTRNISFDQDICIQYAGSVLYVFGEKSANAIIFGMDVQTEQFIILQIDLTTFEIIENSAVMIPNTKGYKTHSLFYNGKLYLCPYFGSYVDIYEYDGGGSLKNNRINLNYSFSPPESPYYGEDVEIFSFVQDADNNFIITGKVQRQITGEDDQFGIFLIKFDPSSKKIKTFNIFRFKAPWETEKKCEYTFVGGVVSFNRNSSKIFFSSRAYANRAVPATTSEGLFLFSLPYSAFKDSPIIKSKIQLQCPGFLSGHLFYAESTNEFSQSTLTVSLSGVIADFIAETDDTTYGNSTYSDIRNDTKFNYVKTWF